MCATGSDNLIYVSCSLSVKMVIAQTGMKTFVVGSKESNQVAEKQK
jgi:hypothetical protein